MKVLYVASEAVPFIKTGGLADVAGSLPKALAQKGVDITVILPLYGQIPARYRNQMTYLGYFYTDLNWRHQYVGLFSLKREGVRYLFVDNEGYFRRDSVYGQGDDGERFTFFAKAVVDAINWLDEDFDIIHCNDWHTGLLPVYIRDYAQGNPRFSAMGIVFTIHNLKYQGVFPKSLLDEVAGIDETWQQGMMYFDGINLMQGGIVYGDKITTVSPSYAQEILHDYFGETLEGVLQSRAHDLVGIINGIDTELYDPETDQALPAHFNRDQLEGKSECKKALQQRAGLPVRDVPVFAWISRLVDMKGIDLLFHIMDEVMQEDLQLVVIGTGEQGYEYGLRHFTAKYPEKCAAYIGFDDAYARLAYAGADYFLMPSVKEPCGISQMLAMRYGTLPIVRETGGLRDTVIPYNAYTGEGTGFSFANVNAHELLYTIKKALDVERQPEIKRRLIRQAMAVDHSWDQSAKAYLAIYRDLHKKSNRA